MMQKTEEQEEMNENQYLIDLDTSNNLVTFRSLVKPLIPLPETVENADSGFINSGQEATRRSLENNPFDQMLHETAKNIRKMQDPFEMILEKCSNQENTKSPYKKLHKSASESQLLNWREAEKLVPLSPEKKSDASNSLELSIGYNVPCCMNSSILDMSAIDDSLSEQGFLKQKHTNEKTPDSTIFKVHGYSEPDHHLKIHQNERQNSLLDLRTHAFGNLSQSSSINSLFFDDVFNKAFRDVTISSSMSDISKISYNSKFSDNISISSNGLLNKAFVQFDDVLENPEMKEDSCSLDNSAFESDLNKVINRSIRKEAKKLSRSLCEIGQDASNEEDILSERAPWEECSPLEKFLDEKEKIESVNQSTPKSKSANNNPKSLKNRPLLYGERKSSFRKSKIGVFEKPNVLPKVLIKPTTEVVETKLKMKPEANPQTKKGPLKAIIPLNEMHKKQNCINFEPVRKSVERRSNLPVACSTPKFAKVSQRGSSSPVAASTPISNRSPCQVVNSNLPVITIQDQVRRSFRSGEFMKTPSPRKVVRQSVSFGSITPNTLSVSQPKRTSRLSSPKVNYQAIPRKSRSIDRKGQNKENAI